MDYNDITEEQRSRAKECRTPEELVALAQEEGMELTDADLEAVACGSWKPGRCTGGHHEVAAVRCGAGPPGAS